MVSPRFAIYFAPRRNEPLHLFGCSVLGRDATTDGACDVAHELAAFDPSWRATVHAPAHYGFHATLKAPFSLAEGVDQQWLREDVAALAESLQRVALGRLRVGGMGNAIALVLEKPPAKVLELEGVLVRFLDGLRAPLSDQDRARRSPETLTERQTNYLDRWGYPFIFDDFRFHMTLTGPLLPARRVEVLRVLTALYQRFDVPASIDDICVFRQADRTSPFVLIERHPLRA